MACLKALLKKTCLVFLMVGMFSVSKAQFLGGIFNQNAAMIKNMIAQIALLQTYIGYVEKGYDIVNKGLTLIGDIKRGDFNLNSDFFNSLERVNPKIGSDARIAVMIAMQVDMVSRYKSYLEDFSKSKVFSTQEINYIALVFTNLMDETATDITDLTNMVTDGKLKMNDAERAKRIDDLYTQVSSKHEFLYTFGTRVKLQQEQRIQELQDISTIQKVY